MSDGIDQGLLWRTRFVWFLIGATASAVLLWNRGGPATASPPVTSPVDAKASVATPPAEAASQSQSPEEPEAAGTSATLLGTTTEAESEASSDTGSGSDGTAATDDGTTGTGTTDGGTFDTDAGTSGETLPSIPLPRMPGTRFMRRFRRPDDQGDGWVVTLGLSVPAPGPQVESFYRSALKDQSMKVFGGGTGKPSASGGYRSTLRARGVRASAEVTINQRAGKLRSVVRIYWRTAE